MNSTYLMPNCPRVTFVKLCSDRDSTHISHFMSYVGLGSQEVSIILISNMTGVTFFSFHLVCLFVTLSILSVTIMKLMVHLCVFHSE